MTCWCLGLLLIAGMAMVDAIIHDNWLRDIKPEVTQGDGNGPETQWFEQPLDHLNITNKNTWKQRYYVRKEFYQQGGPAFLCLEGEYAAESYMIDEYTALDYTKKLKGIIFDLEHRYYGQSRPTTDLSLENMKYLTMEQALEDIAYFIAGMNAQYNLPEGTRWFVLGTSYAGNLAVWARYKFPHLVHATIGYSSPVLHKSNFWDYLSHVRDVIKAYSKDCLEAVQKGHGQMREVLLGSGDLAEFEKKFKLCDAVDKSSEMDKKTIFALVGGNICRVVQYKNRWPITMKDACDIMANSSLGDYIDRYAELNKQTMLYSSSDCLDFKYDKYISQSTSNLVWDSSIATAQHQWDYQTCTEVGGFQTSYQKTHLFSEDLPMDFYVQQCTDIFGKDFNKHLLEHGVARTNLIYGGPDVKATRVVYVNGEEDPWMTLGITKTGVPESPAILVKEESHGVCAFTGVSNPDSKVLKAACKQVEDLVTKWATE